MKVVCHKPANARPETQRGAESWIVILNNAIAIIQRAPVSGRDISPLNISRLLLFDTKSRLFHVGYFCVI
jgi:hypothetical protein